MAHTRKRHLAEYCEKLLKFSPIVGVFGHRQVGKTTYVESISGEYLTLDDRETRLRAKEDPKKFLQGMKKHPAVIDECQLEPDLFPALKEFVRVHKKPGQFLLTGSVRFTSRRAIRESLTGRIVPVEMLPMTISELLPSDLPDSLFQLLKFNFFDPNVFSLSKSSAQRKVTEAAIEKYLSHGGLPGICFMREAKLRNEALGALHQLILDRDLRLVLETRLSLATLHEFLALLAKNGWNSYNAAEVKRQTGISTVTQKNLLFAFESIYLIRRIKIQGRAGEVWLLEDQLEEYFLSEKKLSRSDQLLSLFYRNARAQFAYRMGEAVHFESYWSRDGARVPLVIRAENKMLGFLMIEGEEPTLSQGRSASSFLRKYAEGKIIYLTIGVGQAKFIDSRSIMLPLADLV